MADIDPKELLKKNTSLIVIYVIAIVPIVLWFVLVGDGVRGPMDRGGRPSKGSYAMESKKLKANKTRVVTLKSAIQAEKAGESDPNNPLYTDKHVKLFEETKDLYSKQLSVLKTLVSDRDAALERWFPKYDEDGDPDPNDYITHYRTKIGELVEEFGELLILEEGDEPRLYRIEPNPNQLKVWQKRYWIQKAILASIRDGCWTPRDKRARIVEAVNFTGDTSASGSNKGKSYELIEAKVAFLSPLQKVPKVVEQLLKQEISMQVSAIEVLKHRFFQEDPTSDIRIDGPDGVFADDYITMQLDKAGEFKGEGKYVQEPMVRVSLTVEVLDFKVKAEPKAAEKPSEGAEAGGEGAEKKEGE